MMWWGWNHMYPNMWIIGVVYMAIWLVVIIGAIFLFSRLLKNNAKGAKTGAGDEALEILRKRYAMGEIDREDYLARKQELEQDKMK